MGISSTTGIYSGIDYESLVEKLMTIASQSKTNLETRNSLLTSRITAYTALEAQLISLEYSIDQLGKESLYSQKTVSSANTSVMTASVTGTASEGTYKVKSVRMATSQQYLSDGISSSTAGLGGGSVTLRYGNTVNEGEDLSVLNGGEGIVRGSIKITDRSGTTATIDLSAVQTVDDVIEAINGQTDVQVRAEANGDSIRLIDTSGGTTSNLIVSEVGSGTTAASLGLAGISDADGVADGTDIVWLSEDISLSELNDGNGVHFDTVLDDIRYTLRDGTTGDIDLSPIISGSSTVDEELTLGDVLEVLNAAAPDKLQFSISEDGDRIVATDLTSGSGDFTLTSLNDSEALDDLGLTGTAVDGVITGSRILSGTGTVLLSSLNGGNGLGTLGSIDLTDRSGATATVDLSGAETLDDVINAINNAGIGITAAVNSAGNGIELTDMTGKTTGNLIVANADATNTADALQITADVASASVNSGDLNLQTVSWNTKLSTLNGGDGVASGTFTITDSKGVSAEIDLTSDSIETIGDVIKAINRSGLEIEASLNDTGDGIVIRDTGEGSGTLAIVDGGDGTAGDLFLTGSATTTTDGEGNKVQVIDGRQQYTIDLESAGSLEDLAAAINALGADVTATIINDGSSSGYRLSISSGTTGKQGNLVIDMSSLGDLNLDETIHGEDALILVGSSSTAANNTLFSSSTNKFKDAVAGITVTLKDTSSSAITLTVGATTSNLSGTIDTIVGYYNDFIESLSTYTAYDSDTETAAVLNCDPTAIRLQSELASLLSGKFSVDGTSITSLEQLGISLADDGTLEFDSDKFDEAYEADPDGVGTFFSDEDTGVAAKFHDLLEMLAGDENSTLANRIEAVQTTVEANEKTIERMETQLDKEQTRLYNQFYALEEALASMETTQEFLDSIVYIKADGTSDSSSSSSSSS